VKNLKNKLIGIIRQIGMAEERHPYRFSFFISLAILLFLLLYRKSVDTGESATSSADLQFVNLQELAGPQFVGPKDYTTDNVNVTDDTTTVDRASGSSDEGGASDLAFYPEVDPPKLMSRLQKNYPRIAADENVEATINLDILIDENGGVRNVEVLGIRLNKKLPEEKTEQISREFGIEAKKALTDARFTPSVIDGKRKAVRWNFKLLFKLEE
jgi:hypothetical protein